MQAAEFFLSQPTCPTGQGARRPMPDRAVRPTALNPQAPTRPASGNTGRPRNHAPSHRKSPSSLRTWSRTGTRIARSAPTGTARDCASRAPGDPHRLLHHRRRDRHAAHPPDSRSRRAGRVLRQAPGDRGGGVPRRPPGPFHLVLPGRTASLLRDLVGRRPNLRTAEGEGRIDLQVYH